MACHSKSNSYFFTNNISAYLELHTKHQPKHISEYFPPSYTHSHHINYSPLWNNNKHKYNKLETPTFTNTIHKHHFIFPTPTKQSPYNIISSSLPRKPNSTSSKRIFPIEIPPLTVSKSLYYDNPPSFPQQALLNTTIKHTHYKIKPKHILYKMHPFSYSYIYDK